MIIEGEEREEQRKHIKDQNVQINVTGNKQQEQDRSQRQEIQREDTEIEKDTGSHQQHTINIPGNISMIQIRTLLNIVPVGVAGGGMEGGKEIPSN